ncbi:MAG: GNAT family N-acetyltransferase [Oscillospiraceae bacterium]|nr:GNAT family N-acetyltransferase [Oscillospiraceae bacterium]
MMYKIRQVTLSDLERVTALEASCFPSAEAATGEAFAYRIKAFPERFFVAEEDGEILGIINGCACSKSTISDDLYEPQGHEPGAKNQMIFGLAVKPSCQGRGIGSALMEHMIGFCRQTDMNAVILTCKEEKIGYYERFGFENRGVSASIHGGAVWYDMVLTL